MISPMGFTSWQLWEFRREKKRRKNKSYDGKMRGEETSKCDFIVWEFKERKDENKAFCIRNPPTTLSYMPMKVWSTMCTKILE